MRQRDWHAQYASNFKGTFFQMFFFIMFLCFHYFHFMKLYHTEKVHTAP